MLKKLLVPLALICIVAPADIASAEQSGEVFWGVGKGKDGDSLTVGPREVRLYGIDAPEFDQTCQRAGVSWACGAEAAGKLSAMITGKDVRCVSQGTDQFGRTLAKCSVGPTDVNRTMVALGYAIAFTRYSNEYLSAQESAKLAKRGVWSGTFEAPAEYRSDKRPTITDGSSAPPRKVASGAQSSNWAGRTKANCRIKGNRNRKGQWIYHVPGMPYYDQTRAEDIFCSEAEAQAAGYRRAIVRR